ncbi:MAG: hypothetical protein JW883_02120 [Deltaproteobacteria bacterium]|nr:hypothetical protein [Deltaproteobacteria bacterium]
MNKIHDALGQQDSIFRGVLLAYFVLFLHITLILGLGLLMLLFGGVVTYLPWILAIGGVLIAGSGYLSWRYMKKRGKKLRDILNDPVFEGRTIEINLLGGLASVKLGHSQEPLTIAHGNSETMKQLKEPGLDRSEQLANLARLLKQDLITFDEFLEAKKGLTGE